MAAALGLVLATRAVRADILVDQGTPDFGGGFASTSVPTSGFGVQYAADDFALGSGASATGIAFSGDYQSNTPFADDFTLRIYKDSSGMPGDVAATVALAVARVDSGREAGGLELYQYSATFAPQALSGGSYWLSIVNNKGSSSDYWKWATHNSTGEVAYSHDSPVAGPWTTGNFGDLAFQLIGTSAVPEPASLALLGAGGLALLGAMRRRRG